MTEIGIVVFVIGIILLCDQVGVLIGGIVGGVVVFALSVRAIRAIRRQS